MTLPPERYEPLEDTLDECADLLMKMGVDVRALRMTGYHREDLESLRELTDAETFENGLLRDFGTYSSPNPKKPDRFA